MPRSASGTPVDSAQRRRNLALANLKIDDNKYFDEIYSAVEQDLDSPRRALRERRATPDRLSVEYIEPAEPEQPKKRGRGRPPLKDKKVRKTARVCISPADAIPRRSRGRPRILGFHEAPDGRRSFWVSIYWIHPSSNQPQQSVQSLDAYSESLLAAAQEEQDEKELPFRGILSFENANTYFTRPTKEIMERFRIAKREGALRAIENVERSMIRMPTKHLNVNGDDNPYVNKLSKIECIHFGAYEIDTWYTAPYPEEYSSKSVLHICEFCLKYFNSSAILQRHAIKCAYSLQPPGNEIYRDEESRVAVFEVDGRKNTIYCQNLCLLAKLFLNSKTLYYDVEPFMFYVLMELDAHNNYHFVGYFSKEKLNATRYNLSCILTLPIYQRKGYGTFLIEFSYLLTRREYEWGTPEKPLSDLGLLSYRSYWKLSVARALQKIVRELGDIEALKLSIQDLSNYTGMIPNDVICGLEELDGLLRDPVTGQYAVHVNMPLIDSVVSHWEKKKYVKLAPENLLWKSVILGPSGGINTTTTMVITTGDDGTTTTTVPDSKFDEKGNKLMSNISLITNFMRDDLEDHRDIEEQTMETVVQRLNDLDPDEEISNILDKYEVCYPGMSLETHAKHTAPIIYDEDDLEEEDEPAEGPDDDDVVEEELEEELDEELEELEEPLEDKPRNGRQLRARRDETPRRTLRNRQ